MIVVSVRHVRLLGLVPRMRPDLFPSSEVAFAHEDIGRSIPPRGDQRDWKTELNSEFSGGVE